MVCWGSRLRIRAVVSAGLGVSRRGGNCRHPCKGIRASFFFFFLCVCVCFWGVVSATVWEFDMSVIWLLPFSKQHGSCARAKQIHTCSLWFIHRRRCAKGSERQISRAAHGAILGGAGTRKTEPPSMPSYTKHYFPYPVPQHKSGLK